MSSKNFLALDVGSRRIGLAMADSQVKIAVPFGWLENNENIVQEITELVLRHDINTIVVGYPRNQSGEPTKQTEFVEEFVKQFEDIELDTEIVFQDESLTSVQAEQRLGNKIKDKGEIDAEAASIILQDFWRRIMKIRKRRIWLLVLSIVVAIAGIGALGATVWYKQMLSPVDVNNQQAFRINIKEGMGSSDIAKTLEDNKLSKTL